MNAEPSALSDEFANSPDKQTQWTAFIRRMRLDHAPKELKEVIAVLRGFLLPIASRALHLGRWVPPGPWR